MIRMSGLAAVLAAVALAAVVSMPAAAEDNAHRIVFHIVENDKSLMSEALDNIENVFAHYEEKGETVFIEVVAYAAGMHMLRSDTSPVAMRLDQMTMLYDNLKLVGCGNTVSGMERAHGGEIPLIDGVEVAPTGVAYLIELQEKGYAYVKP